MKYSLLAGAILASAVHAWLPEEQDLAAFNASRFDSLDKRFKPTLPNGVNKIRGVNFGGMLPITRQTPIIFSHSC